MEIVIHALQCGSVGTDETIPDRDINRDINRDSSRDRNWYQNSSAYIDAQGVEVWKNVSGE